METTRAAELLVDEPALKIAGRIQISEAASRRQERALIVALHGGGFTSRYFDIPGFSLFDKAAARGCSVLALDRPGYGSSSPPPGGLQTLSANAEWVTEAVARLWPQFSASHQGVVLVGHSIGSAVALEVAANPRRWPLEGVAVSGIGLRPPPSLGDYWRDYPSDPWISVPSEGKEQLMFGPAQYVPPGVKDLVRAANVAVATRELLEINTVWPERAKDLCGAVTVPVHHRLGEHDALWDVSPAQVAAFAENFRRAPAVDAAMAPNAGHCIDFHHGGASFQSGQAAFAARCVSRKG